ncbi:MAG TPA: Dyp-type peroxidase, partial [Mycobacteriales bacterium]|nr:Dyp-type peroxidase [Mycobacteriales bacterium]
MSSAFSRRRFLTGSAAAGAIGAAAVGVGAGTRSQAAAATPATGASPVAPLYGAHQGTLLLSPAAATAVVAFDVTATTRGELVELMQTLTERARLLTQGEPLEPSNPSSPPADNGLLGPTVAPHQLGMTVAVGASLFDRRFGLTSRRPTGLVPMKTFPNDNLDPAQTHGDLTLQLTAASADIVVHALRDITKYTRGWMQPRWRIDGFSSPPRPDGKPRNLFGFNDGISNPVVTNPRVAEDLIWVTGSGEQAWATGGTFQVIRIIRQLVEFWDRVSLQEQELMIGRRRANGAALDANSAGTAPNYRDDPQGLVIPLSAHIRLANPRTPATASSRILRRGWNYDRGLDVNGNLDQGMLFTCYQRSLQRQFEA